MRRLLPFVLGLAACAAPIDMPLAPIPLRNPTAQVASQADASLARLQGNWRIVQGAGVPVGATVEVTQGQIIVAGTPLTLADLGEGRFGTPDGPLWVHWIDVGNRTAAMGDPGGARVWIMDRATPSPDRMSAAREILEWYGYDLTRLEGA